SAKAVRDTTAPSRFTNLRRPGSYEPNDGTYPTPTSTLLLPELLQNAARDGAQTADRVANREDVLGGRDGTVTRAWWSCTTDRWSDGGLPGGHRGGSAERRSRLGGRSHPVSYAQQRVRQVPSASRLQDHQPSGHSE